MNKPGKILAKDLSSPALFREFLKKNIDSFATKEPSNKECIIILEYLRDSFLKEQSSEAIDLKFWKTMVYQLIKKIESLERVSNDR